jgi:hypothetical protein
MKVALCSLGLEPLIIGQQLVQGVCGRRERGGAEKGQVYVFTADPPADHGCFNVSLTMTFPTY